MRKKTIDSHYHIELVHYIQQNGEMVEDYRNQIADIKGRAYACMFFKNLLEMYRKTTVIKYSWYEKALSNEHEELWVELK